MRVQKLVIAKFIIPIAALFIAGIAFGGKKSQATSNSSIRPDSNLFFQDTTRTRITTIKGTEVVYIINPAKVNGNELTQVTKEFQKEGLSVSFGQNYQNNEIYELTINSTSRGNQGSVTFNLHELRDSKRVIQLKGDTRSGEIFVNACNAQ